MSQQTTLSLEGKNLHVNYAVHFVPALLRCYYCANAAPRIDVQIHSIFVKEVPISLKDPLFSQAQSVMEEGLLHRRGCCDRGPCHRAYERDRDTRLQRTLRARAEGSETPPSSPKPQARTEKTSVVKLEDRRLSRPLKTHLKAWRTQRARR